jgi:hypothetical protein
MCLWQGRATGREQSHLSIEPCPCSGLEQQRRTMFRKFFWRTPRCLPPLALSGGICTSSVNLSEMVLYKPYHFGCWAYYGSRQKLVKFVLFLGTVELLSESFFLPWNSCTHQRVKSGHPHETCYVTCCMCIANQNLGSSKQLTRKPILVPCDEIDEI